MPPGRRDILAGLALTSLYRPASAADYPTKDIHFIIPYASGGGFDGYVRSIIPALQASLPNPVQIIPDNVDGAAGAKAATQLNRARPDGATISVLNIPGLLIVQQQGGSLGFNLENLTWISNLGTDYYGLIVPADSPLKTVANLQALSKQRPVKFTCVGPAGAAWAATRIAGELLGIRTQIIAGYKGTSDYVVAAVRGDGDAAICSLTAMSQFRAGNLIRVVATFQQHSSVPGAEDASSLNQPDLAQIVQLRPVAGPPKLPAPIVDCLAGALAQAVRDPKVVAWAKANEANLDVTTPAQTTAALQQQTRFIERWKDLLRPA
jgi:tripartite-type tricarboxylate transporter receptor subunit TctC